MPPPNNPQKRRRVWNARGIAIALDLYDDDGEPDEAKVFYLVSKRRLKSVRKVGRQLTALVDELEAEIAGGETQLPADISAGEGAEAR
jgi:hypothetical protein